MSKTACLLLTEEVHVCHIGYVAKPLCLLYLSLGLKGYAVLNAEVKEVFHSILVTVGYDKYIGNTAPYRFLYQVVYGRKVHDWQHFLGYCVGYWEHSRSQTCGRDYRLSDFLHR